MTSTGTVNERGTMNRLSKLLAPMLFVTAISCAPSTTLVQRWSDPAFTGAPGKSMAIIAITDTERRIRIWESAFSTALNAAHVTPILGSNLVPPGVAADEATLMNAIRDSKADMVALTRLVSIDKEETYVPGSTSYYAPASAAYGFYPYYYSSVDVVSTPGYYQTDKIYTLETNVYDVGTEKLIWSGVTETLNPETGQDGATDVAQTIVDDMRASKIIAKK
jgi:hypothetical protein